MAEYVRRKRPPATHPYWARLHDRTHPPSGKWAMLVLGLVGLLMGIFSGGRAAWTLYDAAEMGAQLSMYLAVLYTLLVFGSGVRERDTGRPWVDIAASLGASCLSGAGAYIVMVVMFTLLIVLFYYPMSGMGRLYGGLIGGAIWAGVALSVTRSEYRHWRSRQANWPKWEEMGRGHRRRRAFVVNLTVRQVPPPEEDPRLPTGAA